MSGDTKYMISVMKAYEDGKKIECKLKKETEANWRLCEPLWNWMDCDYRISPEPKYVPYDSVEEVERDKWIKSKAHGRLCRILALDPSDNSLSLYYRWISLKDLFELFTYEDGTPCGKKVEE